MTEFDQFLPQGQQLRSWPFVWDNERGWVEYISKKRSYECCLHGHRKF